MPGFFDLFEQKILDHIFTDPTWTPATTLYLGLSTTTPTEAAGSVTEPSGNAYARVSTVAADWNAASATTPAVKDNSAVKTFPMATGSWGTVTHFLLCATISGVTTADYIGFGALTTSKAIGANDTASFAAGALIFQAGDPGDTY
jgi:hypothetical protein